MAAPALGNDPSRGLHVLPPARPLVELTLCHAVLAAGGLLSASAPLLVLPPSAAAAVEELQQLLCGCPRDSFVRSLGFLLDAAARTQTAQQGPASLEGGADAAALKRLSRVARQLASRLAADLGCPAAAALLEAAQQLGSTGHASQHTAREAPTTWPPGTRQQGAPGPAPPSSLGAAAALLFAALKHGRAGVGPLPGHPLQACRLAADCATAGPVSPGLRANIPVFLSVH